MKKTSTVFWLLTCLYSVVFATTIPSTLSTNAATATLEYTDNKNTTTLVNSACLKRETAIELLLEQMDFDPNQSNVWMPFKDFGFGEGYEGLLPEGTVIEPAALGLEPYPGGAMVLEAPAYFFWVNDELDATFIHQTRFVLLKFKCDDDNFVFDEIETSVQGWWPVINTPDGGPQAFYDTDYNRTTDAPVGVGNPNGLILGIGISSSDLVVSDPPTQNSDVTPDPKAYGLVGRGSDGGEFETDVNTFCDDLMNVHGVPAGNIVKGGGGMGGIMDLDGLGKAIDSLCNLGAGGCTKIYVRLTSHGAKGKYVLGNDFVSASDLCDSLKDITSKNVPVCFLINGCCTGSLVDDKIWGAAPGSTVITGADSTSPSYGHSSIKYLLGTDTVRGSLFPDAFSRCLKDKKADKNKNKKVDECEAYDWVLKTKPCYTWCYNMVNRYPAGPPPGTGGPTTPNPNPQKKKIKSLKIKIESGPNKGRTYSAPYDQFIRTCDGQKIELSVPDNATNIVWSVNGENIDQEGSTIVIEGPSAGELATYSVSYVYNDHEYSFEVKMGGKKCADGENQDVANFQGMTYTTGQLLSSEDSDIAIRLYNEDQELIRDLRFGSEGFDYGYGIAVNNLGHTVTTGTFDYSVEFASETLVTKAYQDIFLVKHDQNGELLWAKRAGGFKDDAGQDIALDDQGNIFVVGYYEGVADFDATILPYEGKGANGFIAKYNAAGDLQWSNYIGGEDHDVVTNVAIDAAGQIYVIGEFSGTAQFGTTSLSTIEASSMFLAKYNTTGELLWVKAEEGLTSESISIDPLGNIIVLAQANNQARILKYNATGTLKADSHLAGTGAVMAKAITTTADGTIHLVGHFYEGIYFKQEVKLSKGKADIFMAQFNAELALDWIKTEGGTEDDFAFGVFNEGTGYTSYAGCHFGTATIGGNTSSAPEPTYIPYLAMLMDGTTTNVVEAALAVSIQKVYPNPFSNNFNIELSSVENQQLRIEILDVTGRTVYQTTVAAHQGNNRFHIQLENQFSEAVYLLQITDQKGQQVSQKIKRQ
ncbi:MAG: T9SS type A sorting domain-containing protein [Saprospiraceae bacterium]